MIFGMNRLSIIDLESGDQPIQTEDGKHVIIFNGEIYNYKELKKNIELDIFLKHIPTQKLY